MVTALVDFILVFFSSTFGIKFCALIFALCSIKIAYNLFGVKKY